MVVNKTMKYFKLTLIVLSLTLNFQLGLAQPIEKIRVLLITGGHGYNTNEFHKMFQAFKEIDVTHTTHPNAHEWLHPKNSSKWDVLVLYDMWQEISPEAKINFLRCLKEERKGLVVLHHALANYQNWSDYREIVGGMYVLEPITRDGQKITPSTYQHDVLIQVQVAAPQHPILKGMSDFTVLDETYDNLDIDSNVIPLLKTTTPKSSPIIGWISPYPYTRVIAIQLGHDEHSWHHASFREILRRSIIWVSGKIP